MGKGSPQYLCLLNSQSRSLKLTDLFPKPLSSSQFVTVFLASLVYMWFQLPGDYRLILSLDRNHEILVLFGVLSGTLLMFFVGIVDDAKSLGTKNKLFFQNAKDVYGV